MLNASCGVTDRLSNWAFFYNLKDCAKIFLSFVSFSLYFLFIKFSSDVKQLHVFSRESIVFKYFFELSIFFIVFSILLILTGFLFFSNLQSCENVVVFPINEHETENFQTHSFVDSGQLCFHDATVNDFVLYDEFQDQTTRDPVSATSLFSPDSDQSISYGSTITFQFNCSNKHSPDFNKEERHRFSLLNETQPWRKSFNDVVLLLIEALLFSLAIACVKLSLIAPSNLLGILVTMFNCNSMTRLLFFPLEPKLSATVGFGSALVLFVVFVLWCNTLYSNQIFLSVFVFFLMNIVDLIESRAKQISSFAAYRVLAVFQLLCGLLILFVLLLVDRSRSILYNVVYFNPSEDVAKMSRTDLLWVTIASIAYSVGFLFFNKATAISFIHGEYIVMLMPFSSLLVQFFSFFDSDSFDWKNIILYVAFLFLVVLVIAYSKRQKESTKVLFDSCLSNSFLEQTSALNSNILSASPLLLIMTN